MLFRLCLLCAISFLAVPGSAHAQGALCDNHYILDRGPCGSYGAIPPAVEQLSLASTVVRSVEIPFRGDGGRVDVDVACPAGQVALAGGLDGRFHYSPAGAVAPTFGGVRLAALADGLHEAPDGWIASASRDLDSGTTLRATLSVVCAPISDVIVVIGSIGPSPGATAGRSDLLSVSCPTGYVTLGGGVDVSDPELSWMHFMAPAYAPEASALAERAPGVNGPATGWTASISTMTAATTKVAAICAAIPGVLTMVSAPSRGSVAVTCPSDYVALGGGVDSVGRQRLAVDSSTPTFAGPPGFPSLRPDGRYLAPAGWYASGAEFGAQYDLVGGVVCVAALPTAPRVQVNVVEFHHAALDHYFRTADPAEAAAIDAGSAGPGWVRTNDNFTGFAAGSSLPSIDVCRFYTFGANSHFYSASADECAALTSPGSGWTFEGVAFGIQLPLPGGGCPPSTFPVYRLYNNRAAFNDSNHRFTTLGGFVPLMLANGWVSEGVAFCTSYKEL